MNYQNIYNKLIERAKNRVFEKKMYVEKHHIIPRCLGGDNSKENIVKLFPKEHYIAHLLLFRMYPNHQGIAYSFWMMCNGNRGDKRNYRISSRIYEEIRFKFIMMVESREPTFKGRKHTEKTKIKISNSLKGNKFWIGKTHSDESKKKMSESALGKKLTKETKMKMSNFWKGKSKSDETKMKMSESAKGENNNYKRYLERTGLPHHNSKPVLQFSLDNEFIKEWTNLSIASKELKLSYKAINTCLSKGYKTSQGFIWKYK